MKRHPLITTSVAIVLLVGSGIEVLGGGFNGRGGRGGGRQMSRPAARPSMPKMSRPTPRPASRPAAQRPSVSRPSVSRPNPGGSGFSRPNINRPSGMKPSPRPATRPAINRPGPNPSFTRPSGRPATTPSIQPSQRPSTRPSLPSLGGAGSRPGGKPATRPGSGDNRPGLSRPGSSGLGSNRPGIGNRPDPGDLGDFLGMNRPIRPETLPGLTRPGDRPGAGGSRPERPETLPGIVRPGRPGDGNGNRPGLGGNRPGRPENPIVGGGNRPNRPGFNGDRPNRPFRPGVDIDLGGNTIINNRPSWVNIDNDRITNISNRWQNQIGGLGNWRDRYPDRGRYWNDWGDGVRDRWHHHHHHDDWFGDSWWDRHYHACGGWHYGFAFRSYPFSYWWTMPTFSAVTNWFSWSTPSAVWSQPVYYDYGQGGNVTYENNTVYIDGQQIASADEFAQSAAVLATVDPPEDESAAADAEWMPLGTFAVSSSEKDVDPTRVIQLAISREGIVSGTLYNSQTDQADNVLGQVDRDTQRVAFRIGESDEVIVETGLYNLTQEEAPVLVHFGDEQVENWLLVRLENPES